jgi:rod shape determining protein RodA
VITIYSATRPILASHQPNYYAKQLLWVVLGLAALVAIVIHDYLWLKKFAYALYVMGLFMLIAVLVVGKSGMGAQRWLNLGIVNFQPSELFRILQVVVIARYFSGIKGPLTKWSLAISFVFFCALPFVLVLKQPHLGTGLILLSTFSFLVMAKKMERRLLVTILITASIIIPISGKTVWKHLKDYQKNRIVAFINPDVDPRGIGYQIGQSKITVGSGMIFGRGFMKGTQGPLKFLPEKHTDFIFSVFAEEWGFTGCVVIFSMYFMLFYVGIDTALKAKDEFGGYVAAGITFMLFLQFLINTGMVLGMLPVVGIPIPFMSYGGTSLVMNFTAVGILLNIRMRRLGLFYS